MAIKYKLFLLGAIAILTPGCQYFPQQKTERNISVPEAVFWESAQQKSKPCQSNVLIDNKENRAEIVAELIVFFNSAAALAPKELQQKITIAKNQYQINQHPAVGLCFAYLQSLTSNTSKISSAQQLLKEIASSNETHQYYQALAKLLSQRITVAANQRHQLRRQRQHNKTLTKQLDALKKQLEALTNIEMNINKRDIIPNNHLQEPKS